MYARVFHFHLQWICLHYILDLFGNSWYMLVTARVATMMMYNFEYQGNVKSCYGFSTTFANKIICIYFWESNITVDDLRDFFANFKVQSCQQPAYEWGLALCSSSWQSSTSPTFPPQNYSYFLWFGVSSPNLPTIQSCPTEHPELATTRESLCRWHGDIWASQWQLSCRGPGLLLHQPDHHPVESCLHLWAWSRLLVEGGHHWGRFHSLRSQCTIG